MIVRELLAKLGFDFDGSGAGEAEKSVSMVKKALFGAAGGAAAFTTALGAVILHVANTAGRLNDLEQRSGVAATTLQELEHAAKLNGVGSAELTGSMTILARTMSAAARGSAEASAAFAAAGVSLRRPNGELKSADEVMGDVAEKFAAMPNGTKKAGLALQLFGRSGASLIPMLNAGRSGLEEMRQEARDLGLVMSEDTVHAGDELGDNIDRLKAFVEGLARTLAGPMLEPLSDVLHGFIQWARANRELIRTRVTDFARVLITIFRGLASVVSFLYNNVRLLAVLGIAVLTGVIYANAAAVATTAGWYGALGIASVIAGAKAAAAWIAAAAPAALLAVILAAVLLIIEDVYTYLQGGDSLIGELGPKWTAFLDSWTTVKGGDPEWLIMLKSAVAFASDLETTVPRAIAQIRSSFAEFFGWLIEKAVAANQKVAEALTFGLYKGDQRTAFGAGVGAQRFAEGFLGAGGNPLLGLASGAANTGMFGGGASPAASVQTSAKTPAVQVAAPINMPITVHGVPGQDATAVAGEVRKQVDEALQQHLNAAAAATH